MLLSTCAWRVAFDRRPRLVEDLEFHDRARESGLTQRDHSRRGVAFER
jgi:hypothetical protein